MTVQSLCLYYCNFISLFQAKYRIKSLYFFIHVSPVFLLYGPVFFQFVPESVDFHSFYCYTRGIFFPAFSYKAGTLLVIY